MIPIVSLTASPAMEGCPANNRITLPLEGGKYSDLKPEDFLEAEFDSFLKFAVAGRLADIGGLLLREMSPPRLPQLSEEQLKFLNDLLQDDITFVSRGDILPQVSVSPKKFLADLESTLAGRNMDIAEWSLIGGAVRKVFNTRYLQEVWSSVIELQGGGRAIGEPRELLPDFDFSGRLKDLSANPRDLFLAIEETVCHLYRQREVLATQQSVRAGGFQMFYLSEESDRFVVAKMGDGIKRNLEVKLYCNMRPCLFTVDAWKIKIDGERPRLSCVLPGWEWQSLIDISAKLVRACEPRSINKMGWSRMCILITDGYRCPDRDLVRILWENMAKDLPPCNIFVHLKRCFFNHFPEAGVNAKVYFLNASIHIFFLHEDKEALENIWRAKEGAILSSTVAFLLDRSSYDFRAVLLMLQLLAFMRYYHNHEDVSLTKHQKSSYFQLKIISPLKAAYLLIPVGRDMFKELKNYLEKASRERREAFAVALSRMHEEFNLPFFSFRRVETLRIKKMNILGCSYFPLFRIIDMLKGVCDAKIIFQLLLIRKKGVLESVATRVPDIIRVLSASGEEEKFRVWLCEMFSLDSSLWSRVEKDKIDLKWMDVLIDVENFAAADRLWRFLMKRTDVSDLGAIVSKFALFAAEKNFSVAVKAIMEALKSNVWESDEALYIVADLLLRKVSLSANGSLALMGAETLFDIFLIRLKKRSISPEMERKVLFLSGALFNAGIMDSAFRLFTLICGRSVICFADIAWEIWQDHLWGSNMAFDLLGNIVRNLSGWTIKSSRRKEFVAFIKSHVTFLERIPKKKRLFILREFILHAYGEKTTNVVKVIKEAYRYGFIDSKEREALFLLRIDPSFSHYPHLLSKEIKEELIRFSVKKRGVANVWRMVGSDISFFTDIGLSGHLMRFFFFSVFSYPRFALIDKELFRRFRGNRKFGPLFTLYCYAALAQLKENDATRKLMRRIKLEPPKLLAASYFAKLRQMIAIFRKRGRARDMTAADKLAALQSKLYARRKKLLIRGKRMSDQDGVVNRLSSVALSAKPECRLDHYCRKSFFVLGVAGALIISVSLLQKRLLPVFCADYF